MDAGLAVATERPAARARRRRLAPSVVVSLLGHLVLLAAIILLARQPFDHPPEWVPPSMDMVFEGGTAKQPNPTAQAPELQRALPRSAPNAGASAPPVPRPQTAAPAPILPRGGAEIPKPNARPEQALGPEALPLPPSPPPHSPTTSRPTGPPAFPAPMALSFGPPITSRPAPERLRRGIDLSLGQSVIGSENAKIFGRADSKQVGPDWFNRFEAWWERHAYYPPQAGENGEQGEVTLDLVIRRDGKVNSAILAEKSGSQWLDMAALGVFRDARLPELPSDAAATVPIHLTIHYVIVRR